MMACKIYEKKLSWSKEKGTQTGGPASGFWEALKKPKRLQQNDGSNLKRLGLENGPKKEVLG